jgi:hypothetical protein
MEVVMDRLIVSLMKEVVKSSAAAQKANSKAYRDAVRLKRATGQWIPVTYLPIGCDLRHLYVAYAMARGRDQAYIDTHVDRKRKDGTHKRGPIDPWTIRSIQADFEKKAAVERSKVPQNEEENAAGPR